MASNNLIVKNIIKFKIEYFVCDMVSPKISTVLGQRRINSTEFFDLLKTKIEALNIKKTCKIVFKVFVYVYDIDNYSIFLKMPSVSSLVNHFFLTEKNFTNPGYILRHSIKNIIRIKFNYILTPFLLYEIIKYKYNYERIDDLDLYSYYKKTLSSLRSKGINVYYKGFNKNTSRNYYSKSNLSLINNKRNYSIFSKNSIRYSTFKRNNNRLKLNNNIFLKGNIICYSNFFKKGKSKVIYFIQNSRLFRFIIYLPFFILFYFLYNFFRLFYYIIYKLCTLLIINNTIKINKRYNTSKELNNYDLKESSLKIHE
jgi:ribosomal protein L11